MPTFTDLPPELVVFVSRYLFPSDFNNLRLVSKSINRTAEAFVNEYRDLQVRYASHTNHGIWNAGHSDGGSLAGLLRDLIRTPVHAPYVHKLSLHRWYTRWNVDWHQDFYSVGSAQKELERRRDTEQLLDSTLTEDVNGCLSFAVPGQFDHWAKEVRLGSQTAILGLLIMKLPCLSALHLTNIDHFDNSFNNAVLCIAKAPTSGLLSRLTVVTVSLLGDRAGICLITAFASLPSMRILHAESIGLGDSYNNRKAQELMPIRSGLTELSLRYTGYQGPLLLGILNSCQNLKVFEFLVDPHNRKGEGYQKRALSTQRLPYNGLGKSTWATSVERILLRDYNPDVPLYKTFFRRFRFLKEVDIELRIIFGGRRHSANMMVVLPQTVGKVILRYEDEYPEEDFRAVVNETCGEDGHYKLKKMPYLQHIHFQAMEAPIPNPPMGMEPEEYRGNRFPIVENNPCFLYSAVQRCLSVGVTLTTDI